jgi:hypothetical protein
MDPECCELRFCDQLLQLLHLLVIYIPPRRDPRTDINGAFYYGTKYWHFPFDFEFSLF